MRTLRFQDVLLLPAVALVFLPSAVSTSGDTSTSLRIKEIRQIQQQENGCRMIFDPNDNTTTVPPFTMGSLCNSTKIVTASLLRGHDQFLYNDLQQTCYVSFHVFAQEHAMKRIFWGIRVLEPEFEVFQMAFKLPNEQTNDSVGDRGRSALCQPHPLFEYREALRLESRPQIIVHNDFVTIAVLDIASDQSAKLLVETPVEKKNAIMVYVFQGQLLLSDN